MSTFTCTHDALEDAMHVHIEDAVAWVRNGGAWGLDLSQWREERAREDLCSSQNIFQSSVRLHCVGNGALESKVATSMLLMLGLVRRLSL